MSAVKRQKLEDGAAADVSPPVHDHVDVKHDAAPAPAAGAGAGAAVGGKRKAEIPSVLTANGLLQALANWVAVGSTGSSLHGWLTKYATLSSSDKERLRGTLCGVSRTAWPLAVEKALVLNEKPGVADETAPRLRSLVSAFADKVDVHHLVRDNVDLIGFSRRLESHAFEFHQRAMTSEEILQQFPDVGANRVCKSISDYFLRGFQERELLFSALQLTGAFADAEPSDVADAAFRVFLCAKDFFYGHMMHDPSVQKALTQWSEVPNLITIEIFDTALRLDMRTAGALLVYEKDASWTAIGERAVADTARVKPERLVHRNRYFRFDADYRPPGNIGWNPDQAVAAWVIFRLPRTTPNFALTMHWALRHYLIIHCYGGESLIHTVLFDRLSEFCDDLGEKVRNETIGFAQSDSTAARIKSLVKLCGPAYKNAVLSQLDEVKQQVPAFARELQLCVLAYLVM